MAIKAGQILHVGNGFLVDRIQSAGAGSINVNTERIEELGNYLAVATTRDIPDLSFEMETYDMGTEIHELLFNAGAGDADGTDYNVETDIVPMDIISPFKGEGVFTTVRGLIIPYLNVESLAYNFSIDNPASLTVGLRGDSIFYVPGSVYQEVFVGDGIATDFTFGAGTGGTAGPALAANIDGTDRYALSVMIEDTTTTPSTWTRLRRDVDFTDTSTTVDFGSTAYAATDNIYVTYGNSTAATYNQGVHKGDAALTPAAVKGRHIEVQFGGSQTSWLGVQSASIEWRATLERDEEFNNSNVVDQDFDTPEVSGTITMKAATAADMFDQILAIHGITSPDIVVASETPPSIDLRVLVKSPTTGATIQTLNVPDAQFDPEAIAGQVGNKLEVDFNFNSAAGDLDVYKADI
jgi:hypothetical protein